VCYPGDAIVGDRDGIVVVARSLLPTLAERLKRQDGYESSFREKVRASVR